MRDGSEGCWEDNFMVEAGSHRSLTDPHKRKYRPKGTWEMESEREILEICVETSLPIDRDPVWSCVREIQCGVLCARALLGSLWRVTMH